MLNLTRIDPLHLKRVDISHIFTESQHQRAILYPEIENMNLTLDEKKLVHQMKGKGAKNTEIIDEISSNRYKKRFDDFKNRNKEE